MYAERPWAGARPAGKRAATVPPLVSRALPVVGHAPEFLRDQPGLLERGHAEHGQVFRLRLGIRPAVFLLGPDLARWAFRETDHGLEIGPSLAFTRRLFGPDFYFLAAREEYLHQREIMLPLFRGRIMASYFAPIMLRRAMRPLEVAGFAIPAGAGRPPARIRRRIAPLPR